MGDIGYNAVGLFSDINNFVILHLQWFEVEDIHFNYEKQIVIHRNIPQKTIQPTTPVPEKGSKKSANVDSEHVGKENKASCKGYSINNPMEELSHGKSPGRSPRQEIPPDQNVENMSPSPSLLQSVSSLSEQDLPNMASSPNRKLTMTGTASPSLKGKLLERRLKVKSPQSSSAQPHDDQTNKDGGNNTETTTKNKRTMREHDVANTSFTELAKKKKSNDLANDIGVKEYDDKVYATIDHCISIEKNVKYNLYAVVTNMKRLPSQTKGAKLMSQVYIADQSCQGTYGHPDFQFRCVNDLNGGVAV